MTLGPPYLPFGGGRFRLTMGLLPLVPERWIEIDAQLAAELAAKEALLRARHDAVFAALPEAAAPARALLGDLVTHLVRNHADIFRRDGDRIVNRATGASWALAESALHPLDLCGRLVQEDFCLIDGADGTPRLIGASLCAPSRWLLGEKIGRPLAAIHAPVPFYDAALARPVDHFFARMKPDKPVWRLNWTILDDPAPFQPEPSQRKVAIDKTQAGAQLWLRVERQTLRRLAHWSAIVFTIRTYITRLDAAVARRTDAAALAALIRDTPAATLAYKHITPFRDALLAWLDARTATLMA